MQKNHVSEIKWIEKGNPSKGTIIFLHAMAGSATAWSPQLDAFSNEYRCISWDMPGFGESPDAPEGADMDWIVKCLASFVKDTLQIKTAHFVGLSVGGMIIQHFAATNGHMIDSIAILDSSPKFGFGGDMKPSEFAEPILADLANGKSPEDFSNGMIRAIVGPTCSEETKLEAISAMSRSRVNGLALTTRLIADHDALQKLSKINCSTLVMAGADDGETPPAYAHTIASYIPNASVTIIPNAGHIVNLENPTSVNKRLRFFLENAL